MTTLNDPEWIEWYNSRPEVIRKAIDMLPPDKFYEIKDSGAQCVIQAYTETPDGVKLRVQKTGVSKKNYLPECDADPEFIKYMNCGVFGLSLDSVVPWEAEVSYSYPKEPIIEKP